MSKETLLKKDFKESDVQRIRNIVNKDFTSGTKIQTGYRKSSKKHKKEIYGKKEVNSGLSKTVLNKTLLN